MCMFNEGSMCECVRGGWGGGGGGVLRPMSIQGLKHISSPVGSSLTKLSVWVQLVLLRNHFTLEIPILCWNLSIPTMELI